MWVGDTTRDGAKGGAGREKVRSGQWMFFFSVREKSCTAGTVDARRRGRGGRACIIYTCERTRETPSQHQHHARTYSRGQLLECVIAEPQQQRALPHPRVPHKQKLDEVVEGLLVPSLVTHDGAMSWCCGVVWLVPRAKEKCFGILAFIWQKSPTVFLFFRLLSRSSRPLLW